MKRNTSKLKKKENKKYPYKKSRILVLFIFGLFLLSLTSAVSLKEFDKEIGDYGKITIDDRSFIDVFGWFQRTTKELILEENTDSCGGDTDCLAIIDIVLKEKGTLVEDVLYKRSFDNGNSWVDWNSFINWKIYVENKNRYVEQDVYEWKCVDTKEIDEKNGTAIQECSSVKIGTETIDTGEWVLLELGKQYDAGNYKIKLWGSKKGSTYLDWMIKTSGIVLNEWAVWGSSFEVTEYQSVKTGSTPIDDLGYYKGQNFTVGTVGQNVQTELTELEILIYKSGSPGDVNVSIYTQDENSEPGEIIESVIIPEEDISTYNPDLGLLLKNVSFTNVILSANTSYFFILQADESSATDTISFGTSFVSDEYAGGSLVLSEDDGASWTALSGDAYFKLYGYVGEGIITLNSPADASIQYTNLVTTNASANITGGAYLVNATLYDNSTGTWGARNSSNILGGGGLVAYYTLDETSGTTALDSYGSNDGTASDARVFTSQINGIINTGADFTQGDDYINTATKIPTGNFTFSYWQKLNATATSLQVPFSQASGSGTALAIQYYSQNAPFLCFEGANLTARCTSISNANTNWINIVWVNDNGVNKIYADGNLVQTRTISAGPSYGSYEDSFNWNFASTEGGIDLGRSEQLGRYFNGNIDEVGIWNKSLTQEEIIALYNSGAGSRPSTTSSTQTLTNTYPAGSNTLWNMKFCDTDGDCGFATSNRTFLIPFSEINRTHNSSSYETASETFSVNISNSNALSSVKLLYNGTEYSTTKSGDVYSTTFDIPSTNIGNNSIRYKVVYLGVTYYLDTTYQNVEEINFIECNGTYATNFLNISFKDESDLSSINASIPNAEFEYYLGSGTETKTYNFLNNTNNYNYNFCATPNKTFYVIPYVQYKQGTDYPQRIWNPTFQSYNNTLTNQILYLLGSTNGIYVTFQIVNIADQTLEGVEVTATREVSGTTTVVGQGTSGADGSVTLWLNPDFIHTFTFEKTGYDIFESSFAPTQSSYTITLGTASSSIPNYLRGIDYLITPRSSSLIQDQNYNFTLMLTSSYWDLESYGFHLRLPDGTLIPGFSTDIEGATLTLLYNVTNNSRIYMDYWWVINETYTNGTRDWIIYSSEKTDWSISVFFTDLNSYMDSGIFGLDDFGRYLIIFIIIFLSVGIMSYKYGLTSPMVVFSMIFLIIFFFDVVVGLIPDITIAGGINIPYLLTFLTGLILVLVIFKEVSK